jgi:diaminopimelate epimerase
MHFTKLQGLGNNFVLVDARNKNYNWSQLAKVIYQRDFGIGADGLLVLLPSEQADFRMRIFNPDGTEAETCGNGLRCFVRYLADNMVPNNTTSFIIETLAGIRQAKLLSESGRTLIQVGMGKPEFKPAAIPVDVSANSGKMFDIMLGEYPVDVYGLQLTLNFISMGNPHAVCFIDEPVANFPLETIGPAVAKHNIFPRETNFEVARVLSRHKIEMRVWERGAGETLACGSGACATAIAAQLMGLSDEQVEILLPGGSAYVQWSKGNEALLTGPAEPVFSGEWPE